MTMPAILAPAIPAATLVLLRAEPAGDPTLLMIERGSRLAFAPGAMVFPGGRVDPGDRALAAALGGEPVETAARVAAIRETIEEVGIAVGISPTPDMAAIGRLRRGLAAGADFATLLADGGLTLDLAALIPFARWRPSHSPVRLFDTFFFLAAAPAGAIAEPDGGESVHALWATARALLAAADAGERHMIFPTRRNLERLAQFESPDSAFRHAAGYPIETISPWIEERDGETWLCIPAGRGYPVTAQRMTDVQRG